MKAFLAHLKRNAEESRRIHHAIHETHRQRHLSDEHMKQWLAAVKEFHDRWDELAFPGGVRREFDLLRQGDNLAMEKAMLYLEHPPYSFRSQYIATKIRRTFNKLTEHMSKDLQDRLQTHKKQILERRRAKWAAQKQ